MNRKNMAKHLIGKKCLLTVKFMPIKLKNNTYKYIYLLFSLPSPTPSLMTAFDMSFASPTSILRKH